MSIQSIQCVVSPENTLAIRWTVYADVHALSICVAYDSEFTENVRHFVVPKVSSISLDVGHGAWYIRIGAWSGEPTHGSIDWSTIYGPVNIDSPRPILAEIPFNPKELQILHKQSILQGVRIHLGLQVPNYILIAMSEAADFPASATKYRYTFRKDYIDWEGLLYPNTYVLRMYRLGTELPTDAIVQLDQGRTLSGIQCSRPLRHGDASSKTTSRGDSVLIRDNEGKETVRFDSYYEYMRYKGAKAKYADKKYEP